jgi:tetratricopeptide (TPR) repeat protein
MHSNKNQFVFILAIVLFFSNLAFSQNVITYPNSTDNLGQRWDWALKEAKSSKLKDGYWIGYSIQRLMGENSYIGAFHSPPRAGEVPLDEIIYGKKDNSLERKISDEQAIKKAAETALKKLQSGKNPEEKTLKDVAILFQFDKKSSPESIEKVKISNLTLYVDLNKLPLIWLGSAEHAQSIPLLERIYKTVRSTEIKEKLVTAVGIHEPVDLTMSFLEKVLNSNDPDDVRENAAFWMGQQNTEQALKILLKTAQTDRSNDVREKAVFGISQIKIAGATDALINLAENADDEEVREKAIFWLGQREGEKALKFLVKVAKSDPSSDVQEKAVFAISQMKSDQATTELIDLAYHAREDNVRKKAIFWLGQKASKKAVAALEDVANNDSNVEVQKQAVFALTQLPDHQAVPNLIKIAKNHPSRKVRKQAIFWLGQSDDPRALNALVEMVRK